jgi:phosphoribosylanthranilate isomerase
MKTDLMIKVCGMRDSQNIKDLIELEPDFMGFIFYHKSPRFIGTKLPKIEIPDTITKVGVFVNSKADDIQEAVEENELDMVQLHGKESPELCETISRQVKVIKAFQIQKDFDFNQLHEYGYSCEYFLLDSFSTKEFGGSGEKFDWKQIDDISFDVPVILSGGIGPDDIELIQSIDHPDIEVIDINSKFEIRPGVKKIEQLDQFMSRIK